MNSIKDYYYLAINYYLMYKAGVPILKMKEKNKELNEIYEAFK